MSFFTAPAATEGSNYEPLEEGAYEAILCGMTAKNFKKYQSEEVIPKLQFIFQIKEGDQLYYLRTKPMTNTINDKSNLFLCISGLTGAKLEQVPLGTDYTKMIGIQCQISVVQKPSPKDPNVIYNEIGGFMKKKKSQKNQFTPDDKAPWYLNEGVLECCWIQGLAFAPKPAEQNQSSKQFVPPPVQTQMGDSSAFFGQQPSQGFATPNSEVPVSGFPQQAGPVSAPSPYVPPQPKQVPQQAQYTPPAAPAPQPVYGQATTAAGNTYQTQQAPQVNDEDNLPF